MKDFSQQYREAIEASLKGFLNNGDDVACIGYYKFTYGTCQMCPKEGIKWHYVLENLRTNKWLIVGSECVTNYHLILAEWGYTPDKVVFPRFLSSYTRWFGKDAVVYDDAIVMRFRVDCAAIINDRSKAGQVEHYRHVTRIGAGGKLTQIVGIDHRGRKYPLGLKEEEDFDVPYLDGDIDEEFEERCDCGGDMGVCPDCDNEICLECGDGCTC